ncbi:hypothetical protein AVEN_36218-1 [Araneus ventricosus]|uniref:Uncharacterized protein n=1 Tax=Araneus ventricosus TaxID=182803 RepID=A0A4Y2UL77_ARAVE|nr:hypothetical protein AVEN_36218-1 [Araneus ventricosus]
MGRSKTWRFIKISSSNFLTITILSLCARESETTQKQNCSDSTPLSMPMVDSSDVSFTPERIRGRHLKRNDGSDSDQEEGIRKKKNKFEDSDS